MTLRRVVGTYRCDENKLTVDQSGTPVCGFVWLRILKFNPGKIDSESQWIHTGSPLQEPASQESMMPTLESYTPLVHMSGKEHLWGGGLTIRTLHIQPQLFRLDSLFSFTL